MSKTDARSNGHAEDLNGTTFDSVVIGKLHPFLVLVSTEWSGSCHIMNSIVAGLAGDFKGRIRFGRLDLDRHPDVPKRFGVYSVPSILLFNRGLLIDRIIGTIRSQDLRKKLEGLIE